MKRILSLIVILFIGMTANAQWDVYDDFEQSTLQWELGDDDEYGSNWSVFTFDSAGMAISGKGVAVSMLSRFDEGVEHTMWYETETVEDAHTSARLSFFVAALSLEEDQTIVCEAHLAVQLYMDGEYVGDIVSLSLDPEMDAGWWYMNYTFAEIAQDLDIDMSGTHEYRIVFNNTAPTGGSCAVLVDNYFFSEGGEYSVTFESGNGESETSQMSTSDGALTVPTADEVMFTSPEGYAFAYWTYFDGTDNYAVIPGEEETINEDMTWYAVWGRTYTVEYYDNYDNNYFEESAVQYAGHEVQANTFEREHYSFTGWNTAADGSGTAYQPGDIYDLPEDATFDTVRFYAQWQEAQYDITISFDGAGADGAMGNVQQAAGSEYQIPECAYVRDGYLFMGWNTEYNGDGDSYQPGDMATFEEDVTLYAQWVEIVMITISFDGNGADEINMDDVNIEVGDEYVIPNFNGTYEGYTFLGWNTDMYGEGDSYQPGERVTFTEDVTLYAQWPTLITISFDGNGADECEMDDVEIMSNEEYTIPAFRGTYEGYTFLGWCTDMFGEGEIYQPGQRVTFTEDVTLYAQWPTLVTISFDGNGADECEMDDVEIMSNVEYTIPAFRGTYEGHTFMGWCTDMYGEGDIYQPGQRVTFTEDVTLYALWPTLITISFDGNGADECVMEDVEISSTDQYLIPNFTGVYEGHTFMGWCTDMYGEGDIYQPGQRVTFTEDVTLYAVWPPFITISFDGNGADQINMADVDYEAIEPYVIPDFDGSYEGHEFLGWNTAADGTGTIYQPGQSVMFTEDVTLYAQWPMFVTISFDGNGATNFEMESVEHNTAEPYIMPAFRGSYLGHTFRGWCSDRNGLGDIYQPGQVVNVMQDMTYYAVWDERPVAIVHFDLGGAEYLMDDVEHDISTPFRIPAVGDVYPFHEFDGWLRSDNGAIYHDGDMVILEAGDIYLTAQWHEVPTVRVFYYANHPYAEGTMAVGYAEQFRSFVVPRGNYYVDGYRFVGWCTRANGDGDTIAVGSTMLVEDVDITLHALWEVVPNPFTIIFDGNGAAGNMPHITIESGVEYVLPDGSAYTYAGHRFVGWNVEADGSGRGYAAGHPVVFTNDNAIDITLYAQWEESTDVNGFYVTFDGNGAYGYMPAGIYEPGTPYIIPTCTMVYPLHVFVGWNTEPDGSGVAYPVGARYVRSENTTLYAQWEMPVRVVYYANNGTILSSSVVVNGEDPNGSEVLPCSFTFANHAFVVWNDNPNGNGRNYAPGDRITEFTDSVFALYAQWEESETITIRFDANGGDGFMPNYYLVRGYSYTIPECAFTYGYREFLGWNTSSDGNGTTYHVGETVTFPDYNVINLYAMWGDEPVPTRFTVTLDANGGRGTMAPVTLDSGSYFVIPRCEYTRRGYTFRGWSYNPNGVSFVTEDIFVDRNITLYAIWGNPDGIGDVAMPELSVYPNPVVNMVNVKGVEVRTLEVLDLAGRRLLEASATDHIDVSSLGEGVYMLRIEAAEGMALRKIIKK